MITFVLRLAGLALLMCSLPLLADSSSDFDALVDFGDLEAISGGKEPSVEIHLGGALLSFLRAATEEEDSELAETLGGLKSIQIKVFEIADGQYDTAREQVSAIARRLKSNDWLPTVKINAEDTTVQMYMKMNGESVTGMTVMILEEDSEAVFINIVGNIDPDQLGRVADKFGVDLSDID